MKASRGQSRQRHHFDAGGNLDFADPNESDEKPRHHFNAGGDFETTYAPSHSNGEGEINEFAEGVVSLVESFDGTGSKPDD